MTSAFAVLATRNAVMLPGAVNDLSVGRPGSVAAIRHAAEREEPILVLLQRKASVDDPGPDDLHSVGTLCRIADASRVAADEVCVGVVGLERVKVISIERRGDALFARTEPMSWSPALPSMPEVLRETLGFLIDHGIRVTFSARTLAELKAATDLERVCALSVTTPLEAEELQLVLEREELGPVVAALATLLDDSWLARFLRWIRT